jgi:hypothetical protein
MSTTIAIKLGETYWGKGFFNIKKKHSDLFSTHDGFINIELGHHSNAIIKGRIERTSNHIGTPRIHGNEPLRIWIQKNYHLNDILKIDVINSTTIILWNTHLSIPPVK